MVRFVRSTPFYEMVDSFPYVVACYYQSGACTTPYKGDDLEEALAVYIKYTDKNRKVSPKSSPLYDVTLYQSGEKAMQDIVHDFPTVVEDF